MGRANGWDHRIFIDNGKKIEADGFELMMVKAYYDKLDTLLADIRQSRLTFGVIHAEKDIGYFLGGEDGDIREGLRLFEINCRVGAQIAAEKLVLHLWSGPRSDRALEKNLSALDALYEIAERYSILLLFENVPCAMNDPITNLCRVKERRSEAQFVYDLRFGAFHEQNQTIVASDALSCGLINHLHISDYVGPPHDFASLRPILHLGEGIIGLDTLLPKIAACYHGTLTLESPEILTEGCAVDTINRDLAFIRRYFDTD